MSMTRKEIREFGQHIVDKILHKKEQDTINLKGWVARNSTRNLYFYKVKPSKGNIAWNGEINWTVGLTNGSFPQVVWEDDKPVACEIMIKIEK